MNEMKTLRDHYDAQPGPTPQTIARVRACLTDQARLTTRVRKPTPSHGWTPPHRWTPPRRWRYALLTAGVAGAAAAAVLLPAAFGGDDTQPAFAAERLPNNTIKVTLREFTDSAGLQRRLNALGVHAAVDYLPQGMTCDPGRAHVDDRVNPQPEVVEDGNAQVTRPRTAEFVFYIHADRIGPGQTLVWEMDYDHDAQGRFRGMVLGGREFLARGPVKPCRAIPVPTR